MRELHPVYLFACLLRRVERRGRRLHARIRAAYHDASIRGSAMAARLHGVTRFSPDLIAGATLSVETRGEGFVEITRDIAAFLRETGADDGVLLAYIRHTSASLVIQENADPDVQTDLVTALNRLAPANAGWVHDAEGPDDMPAHIKAMINGISLHVPVAGGELALGTWQGIYLAEHRARPHRRDILLQFIGSATPGR
jgi:secondary thiamine-phosphate synthase enzyme